MSYLLSSPPVTVAESTVAPWINGAKGILKKDAEGYYCGLLVGALGTYNSSKEFYVSDEKIISNLLTNTIMAKKLAKKVLFIELGHPKKYVNSANGTTRILTDKEYVEQFLTISDRNQCGHVRGIRIVKSTSPDKYGYYPHLIYADVKPDGPFGSIMEARLLDPNQNSCFSMRWLANKEDSHYGVSKFVFECVTFDFVGEGGIELCVKENHLSFEEIRPVATVNKDTLVAIKDECRKGTISDENDGIVNSVDAIINSMELRNKPSMPGSFYI